MYCSNCGNEMNKDTKFCGKCGSPAGPRKESDANLSSGADDESIKIELTETQEKFVGGKSWGALLGFWWAVFSRAYWYILLFFIPYVSILIAVYFIFKGRERVWKYGGWKNFEEYKQRQEKLDKWAKIIWGGLVGIALIGLFSSVILTTLHSRNVPSTTIQDTQWQAFNSVQDQFSILLPSYPTIDSQENVPTNNPLLTYSWRSYKAKDSKALYYINKYTYSSEIDVSNPDGSLEKMLNVALNMDPNNKLISSDYVYLGTERVLNFLLQNKQEFVKGQIIFSGQTPYTLMMDYLGPNYDDANYNKFINSFQLK